MKITIVVFHNLSANAFLEGYKDGNILIPIQEFTVFKINPTIEYTAHTLLDEIFGICNDNHPGYYSEVMPSFKQGYRSLSVGDVIQVTHPSRSSGEVYESNYAVTTGGDGFSLLHG